MTVSHYTTHASEPMAQAKSGMTTALTVSFAASVGAIVLLLYAGQPLVEPIATSFGLSASAAGLAATMSIIGYAAGLLLLVPLSDLVEGRRIILTTLLVGLIALGAAALAPSAPLLFLATFAVGAATSAIQMLVPVAASLAPPARRGRVIGDVMSGLMIGILLPRPISGLAA